MYNVKAKYTVNVNHNETLTFAEWEQIHNAIKEESKAERRYYAKQKALGCVLIALSIIMPFCVGIIPSFFTLPLGIALIATDYKAI